MFLRPNKNIFQKVIYSIIFLSFNLVLFSQNSRKLDSLYTIVKTTPSDTIKINAQLKIAQYLLKDDSVKGIHEIKKAFYTLDKISNKEFNYRSIDKIGRVFLNYDMSHQAKNYFDLGFKKALNDNNREWQARYVARVAGLVQGLDLSKQCIQYFDSALILAKGCSDKVLSEIHMYKGRAHYDVGEYKPAMTHYIESQRIFEKNKWMNVDYGHLLHFIGSVFKQQNFYDKALDYYIKELDLAREIKNKSLEGEALYLAAGMYGNMGELDKEQEYEEKSLAIYRELGNRKMEGLLLGNLSHNYADRKDYKKAIEYCEAALKIYDETGNLTMVSPTLRALGDFYSRAGQHKKGLGYLEKALIAAGKIETKQMLYRSEITKSMAFVYSNLGDFRSAFNLLRKHHEIEDSLTNLSNTEYLHNLETQYQTEKKEKEIALLNADKKIKEDELLRKQTQGKMLMVISGLGLVVAGVSVFAFLNKRKTNRLLGKQVNEINYQNSVIKEKNKDITDSIQYAKRLQEAVFPEADVLNDYFSESFVLFRPRDIVSGDFYWFDEVDDKTIVIVGDCTGHGVPGAFMSILGHNLLNQVILEERITDPAGILQLLDKRVSNALNKRGNKKEYNDGMDIAICVIDKKNNKLVFAGANRPLIIKRGEELIELKPNKFGIGGIEEDRCKLFGKYEIDANENDVLYLFSDGYYDQFGGPNGKKFKYKNLIDHLKAIAAQPLEEQKNILLSTFENWQGNLEQLDDVCVVGLKI
jgi:serine phosphatase RsbU (regulator of sigma subunit)